MMSLRPQASVLVFSYFRDLELLDDTAHGWLKFLLVIVILLIIIIVILPTVIIFVLLIVVVVIPILLLLIIIISIILVAGVGAPLVWAVLPAAGVVVVLLPDLINVLLRISNRKLIDEVSREILSARPKANSSAFGTVVFALCCWFADCLFHDTYFWETFFAIMIFIAGVDRGRASVLRQDFRGNDTHAVGKLGFVLAVVRVEVAIILSESPCWGKVATLAIAENDGQVIQSKWQVHSRRGLIQTTREGLILPVIQNPSYCCKILNSWMLSSNTARRCGSDWGGTKHWKLLHKTRDV
ncbi:hypothetical protein F4777DRAFT_109143 [Nemania sp. FL0916]|nr:hypothetical protein F4777DRAFT_109143 [Nemania sp. FL0916]